MIQGGIQPLQSHNMPYIRNQDIFPSPKNTQNYSHSLQSQKQPDYYNPSNTIQNVQPLKNKLDQNGVSFRKLESQNQFNIITNQRNVTSSMNPFFNKQNGTQLATTLQKQQQNGPNLEYGTNFKSNNNGLHLNKHNSHDFTNNTKQFYSKIGNQTLQNGNYHNDIPAMKLYRDDIQFYNEGTQMQVRPPSTAGMGDGNQYKRLSYNSTVNLSKPIAQQEEPKNPQFSSMNLEQYRGFQLPKARYKPNSKISSSASNFINLKKAYIPIPSQYSTNREIKVQKPDNNKNHSLMEVLNTDNNNNYQEDKIASDFDLTIIQKKQSQAQKLDNYIGLNNNILSRESKLPLISQSITKTDNQDPLKKTIAPVYSKKNYQKINKEKNQESVFKFNSNEQVSIKDLQQKRNTVAKVPIQKKEKFVKNVVVDQKNKAIATGAFIKI